MNYDDYGNGIGSAPEGVSKQYTNLVFGQVGAMNEEELWLD